MKEEKRKIVLDKNGARIIKGIDPARHPQSQPSNTGSPGSFHSDTDLRIYKNTAVLWGPAARRHTTDTSVPMCDQDTVCSPHWHIQPRYSTIKRVHRTTPDLVQHTYLILSCIIFNYKQIKTILENKFDLHQPQFKKKFCLCYR